jgi:XTP/dITP diphosphohydrolase
MKLARGQRLVLASHNKGKLVEFRALLEPFGLTIVSAGELGLLEPDETANSFAGNAALKAQAAADASGLPALSDDSGLSVNALSGAPGIYSARWAGEKKDFMFAMARIERELKDRNTRDYSAFFTCALALAVKGAAPDIFEGVIHGHLEFPPRGTKGFGYDPIFVADGMTKTFGEIDPVEKDAISHRARAFALFEKACLS